MNTIQPLSLAVLDAVDALHRLRERIDLLEHVFSDSSEQAPNNSAVGWTLEAINRDLEKAMRDLDQARMKSLEGAV